MVLWGWKEDGEWTPVVKGKRCAVVSAQNVLVKDHGCSLDFDRNINESSR